MIPLEDPCSGRGEPEWETSVRSVRPHDWYEMYTMLIHVNWIILIEFVMEFMMYTNMYTLIQKY